VGFDRKEMQCEDIGSFDPVRDSVWREIPPEDGHVPSGSKRFWEFIEQHFISFPTTTLLLELILFSFCFVIFKVKTFSATILILSPYRITPAKPQ